MKRPQLFGSYDKVPSNQSLCGLYSVSFLFTFGSLNRL